MKNLKSYLIKSSVIGAIVLSSLNANAAPTIDVTTGDMFLVAYNSVNKDTFVAKLSGLTGVGQTNTFSDANGNLTFNLASIDGNWNTFTSNASSANTQYQILGLDTTNRRLVSTISSLTNPIGSTTNYNTLVGSATTNPTGVMYQFLNGNQVTTSATSLILNNEGVTSGSQTGAGSAWFATMNAGNLDTTVALDSDANFAKFARGGASGSSAITQTADVFGTWKLSDAGTLTYSSVAAVPEADTSLMMLAGLGLMGFIARRKKLSA